jgi:hypothetical protein
MITKAELKAMVEGAISNWDEELDPKAMKGLRNLEANLDEYYPLARDSYIKADGDWDGLSDLANYLGN